VVLNTTGFFRLLKRVKITTIEPPTTFSRMHKTNRPASSGLPHFPALEAETLERWKRERIFQKTLEQTKNGPRFVFFEGPPTANGKPGIHHVLARAFKDVIPRFQTMQGYFVERKAGWDTQGLPVELEVEKQIGVSGKKDIEKYGIVKFNEQCKESVWMYKEEWEKLTERIGFWLDLEHPYITYDKNYIETLWWIFKQIWEKKLLYKDYKVVPQCPRCETALSSHEVAQGYEKVTEDSVYLKFELVDEPGTFVLAWTTTPWTLPGNVALAVGKEIPYVALKLTRKGNAEIVILAKSSVPRVFESTEFEGIDLVKVLHGTGVGSTGGPTMGDYSIELIREYLGEELLGKKYKPLFPIPDFEKSEKAYTIYPADFVSTEEGTGIVHTAVMYGEDDYNLGQEVGLPKIHTVNPDGTFNDLVPKWKGRFVKDAEVEKEIVEDLRSRGLLYKEDPYEHDYPFCWRCHSPLLYYAKDSWFIMMSTLREELQKRNSKINWVPEYMKEGRFGEWLREVKDWAISRERYWGTPIPIWECEKCHERECIGSFAELAERSGTSEVTSDAFDPHRPFIDAVTFSCSCGGTMRRIPEVADTWFDSGAMPFAQWHYPFENKEQIEKGESYPAEYIAEAIDQTRGWFYTLLAIATLLGKDAPYQNVICLGHILDAKGQKMSKHIGNVVDPWQVINEYGADPLRFLLYTVNQPGEYKLFDSKQVGEVVRKTFLLLWNVVNYWEQFQQLGNVQPIDPRQRPKLDQWLLARTTMLVEEVALWLEKFQITNAARSISVYINELSTWYVRRSRTRFKSEGHDRDSAYQSLTDCLFVLTKVMAPFTPIIADVLYKRLGGKRESVHLEEWPRPSTHWKPAGTLELIKQMETVRQIVELGHSLRAESGIKVRQPLEQLVVAGAHLDGDAANILQEELNIREIHFKQTLPTGAEWKKKEAGPLSAALDTTITDELLAEGWYREVVRQVNDLRKKSRLTFRDQIALSYATADERLRALITMNHDRLCADTRAAAIVDAGDALEGGHALALGDATLILSVTR
jgi:isoleucyl-tRNA synthetase